MRAEPMRTVLIGTSLTPESDRVVAAGLALARALGARAHLVHGVPIEAVTGAPGEPWIQPSLLSQIAAGVQARIDEQAQRLGREARWMPTVALRIGAPHRALREEAAQIGADLLVVGAAERHGPLARLLGSTADRALRGAICPVFVVRHEVAIPPRRVLLPVDLSPLSAEGFATGLGFAARLGAGGEAPEIDAVWVVPDAVESGVGRIERNAEERLARFLAPLSPANGDVHAVVRAGDPRQELLAQIEARPVDLVALASHGRSGFERRLLGSLAGDLVRDAPVNLLVIPPREAQHRGETLDEEDPAPGRQRFRTPRAA